MRQSFEEFLREKWKQQHSPSENEIELDVWSSYRKFFNDLEPSHYCKYAEEWSSQQTEGEVYEALKKIAELDPTKDAPKNQFCYDEWGEAECFNKAKDIAKSILARKGNKDGEKGA